MTHVLLRWLHLSDIHIGHGGEDHQDDQNHVMGKLADDATTIAAGLGPIDYVLVTGDLAYSAAALDREEYDKTMEHLQNISAKVGIEKRRFLFVPGNHDVQRTKDGPHLDSLVAARKKQEPVDTDAWLTNRFGNFRRFVRNFTGDQKRAIEWQLTASQAGEPTERALPQDGRPIIRITGVNTAWLSNDGADQGNLVLSKEAHGWLTYDVPTTTERQRQITILLTHHPLGRGWMAKETVLLRRMQNHYDLHLCGHLHQVESTTGASGAGPALVTVHAGAVHLEDLFDQHPFRKLAENEREAIPETLRNAALEHSYSFGELVAGEHGEISVRLLRRRWHAAINEFRWDVQSMPDIAREAWSGWSASPAAVHSIGKKHQLSVGPGLGGSGLQAYAIASIPWIAIFAATKLEQAGEPPVAEVTAPFAFGLFDDTLKGLLASFLAGGGRLRLQTLAKNAARGASERIASIENACAHFEDAGRHVERRSAWTLPYSYARIGHYVVYRPATIGAAPEKAVALVYDSRSHSPVVRALDEFLRADVDVLWTISEAGDTEQIRLFTHEDARSHHHLASCLRRAKTVFQCSVAPTGDSLAQTVRNQFNEEMTRRLEKNDDLKVETVSSRGDKKRWERLVEIAEKRPKWPIYHLEPPTPEAGYFVNFIVFYFKADGHSRADSEAVIIMHGDNNVVFLASQNAALIEVLQRRFDTLANAAKKIPPESVTTVFAPP